jgi:hypothetical protein
MPVASRFGRWFWVTRTLRASRGKLPVPDVVLETLTKAMKEELAKKPDLVSTPEEVLQMIENFQGMVTYFDQTVKAGTL